MTTRYTMTHEINCSVETFWKLTFDKEMNTAMYRDALKFPSFEVAEQRENDAEIFRRTVATPNVDMPAAVQKVLGSGFRYTEESRLDKKTGRATFKGIPSTMPDKLITDGTIRAEAIGPNRTRRIVEVVAEAKVMLIGSVLESTAEKNMRDAYNKNAAFMNQWIADKKLT